MSENSWRLGNKLRTFTDWGKNSDKFSWKRWGKKTWEKMRKKKMVPMKTANFRGFD